LQQEYNNLEHPPAPVDVWICESCEYESIFGEPPHALIRQYEIKDRKERRSLSRKEEAIGEGQIEGKERAPKAEEIFYTSTNTASRGTSPGFWR
jgi:hypothetical protein